MLYIDDATIDRWIKEDFPYGDLTTRLFDFSGDRGCITFTTRDETTICGTEEVRRLLLKLGVETDFHVPSGTTLAKGAVILSGFGSAENIHAAWKISAAILEYASGIATRTQKMIKSVQPHVEVVATRKCFPGTKDLSMKAVLSGGASPHRLGLSETILVFDQHRRFMKTPLPELITRLKRRACEKKVIAEAFDFADAIELCKAGIDGIQFDKVAPDTIKEYCTELRAINPSLLIIAAGGINNENAHLYANTGINAIATGAVYFGKPADIKVVLAPMEENVSTSPDKKICTTAHHI